MRFFVGLVLALALGVVGCNETAGTAQPVGWFAQDSGTTTLLTDVAFVDPNRGVVVGEAGLILGTANGGATWSPQESGTPVRLFGVSFINANTGTAVGSEGTILRLSLIHI